MIQIRLSRDAANYILRETAWLAERSPVAARNFSATLKEAKRILQAFPEAGNRSHGLQITGTLTLVAGNYLLEYVYRDQTVDIVAVRHGRMTHQVPDTEIDEDLD